MHFQWPWEHDETIVLVVEEPSGDRDAYLRQLFRRLRHIAGQNDEILALLRPHQLPVSVSIVTLEGAPMPATLAPGQTVAVSYTEQNADGTNVDPLVGTPAWSVSDGNTASIVDNGDGTATLTATAAGTTTVDLTVTFADNASVNASDSVTVEAAVVDPSGATIVFGTPQ